MTVWRSIRIISKVKFKSWEIDQNKLRLCDDGKRRWEFVLCLICTKFDVIINAICFEMNTVVSLFGLGGDGKFVQRESSWGTWYSICVGDFTKPPLIAFSFNPFAKTFSSISEPFLIPPIAYLNSTP